MTIQSRIVFYVFFDPDGIVDDYVLETLKSLRSCCQRMVVVCNGYIEERGEEKLSAYCDDLMKRPNTGYDAAAFKDCLLNYLSWTEVEKYDELVFLNDTFYGPINDTYQNIFHVMEEREEIDFWGLSCGYKQIDVERRSFSAIIPEHVQSFFIVFRKNVILSKVFKKFWKEYNSTINDFSNVVFHYELALTKTLMKSGFRWAVYSDTEDMKSSYPKENYNIYGFSPYELLRYHNFPFVKRKNFNMDLSGILYMSDLECMADTLNYIQEESNYDEKLIWQNLLRRYNITSLYRSLHINYVLPSVRTDTNLISQAALIYYCSNPDCMSQMLRSAEKIVAFIDVYFIPDISVSDEDRKAMEKSGMHILTPTGIKQCMGGFVLKCRELTEKYRFLGFIHDENNTGHDPRTVIDSVLYNYLQNIANDASYITQVLSVFEKNTNLGVLAAPMPIHNKYAYNLADAWGNYFGIVEKLTKELELTCKMDSSIPPLMLSGSFWCRSDVIKDIWKHEWTTKEFRVGLLSISSALNEGLKRIMPFLAQSRGYYSGIVMHTNYASVRLDSEEYMLRSFAEGKRLPLSNSVGFRMDFDETRSYTETDENNTKIVYRDIGIRGALGIYIKKHLPEKIASNIVNLFRLY